MALMASKSNEPIRRSQTDLKSLLAGTGDAEMMPDERDVPFGAQPYAVSYRAY